ncbi:dATP/dGTP diphosphohydrolase domain-containing protein [Mesorhizobium sp.]|uniref:dATP/dGTP diphosphohydrolase domain-containing protein n=1 Tax=Mesorhizobium sp. TaxID=1871066 RepID=UPI0025C19AED|nr:dATP/dGTP diphosphohydrolase domain-containing protein [Mesorhizobium sp.]
MNTVIVYGPRACGKTTNAELLRKHYDCGMVLDVWDTGEALTPGALHLTNDATLEGRDVFNRRIAHSRDSMTVPVYTFAEAMAAATQLNSKLEAMAAKPDASKATNPKDSIGARKWRQYATVPSTVAVEIGVAMLEGAAKYGRHNYRVAGVRASVYVDAAKGHIDSWWEGEDYDPDVPGQKLSHITKAIASLVVLRDAMIQDMLNDDRPPKANLDKVRADMQVTVEAILDKYPEPKAAFTEIGVKNGQGLTEARIDPSKININFTARSFGAGGLVPGAAEKLSAGFLARGKDMPR